MALAYKNNKYELNLVRRARKIFLERFSPKLNCLKPKNIQKSKAYLDWLNYNLIEFIDEFVVREELNICIFIESVGRIFHTGRFRLLIRRWMVDYCFQLFNILYDFSDQKAKISLEDTPLNRFAVEKFSSEFSINLEIDWVPEPGYFKKIIFSLSLAFYIALFSLKTGVKLFTKRKKYKVMRESLWGLSDSCGHFFHDDFFIDGNLIKKEELLLFSRSSIAWCHTRLNARQDAVRSDYKHFYLPELKIGIHSLLSRIIPKYIARGCLALLRALNSGNFWLLQNVYCCFISNALPYEKVFSHFKVDAELGHNYFSYSHIPESIVCQNYGVKYYLMHWSDNAVGINKFVSSFLGCDKYLVWGLAHIRGVEEMHSIVPIGYVFKKFIFKVIAERKKFLSLMGINARGKIITFFDESFGNIILMTENQFLEFWKTILKVSRAEKENTIVVKPKDLSRYENLSRELKNEFLKIKAELEKMPNVYILAPEKWSFIEAIGISDLVITQGMTSSATIAIICGINALYLDQADYDHPLSRSYKESLVFEDPEKIIRMIQDITEKKESPASRIPEDILRQFDAFSDGRGIDILRGVLANSHKRVGIIIQARMGSTRLPGKVMLPLSGKPVLEHIIDRLRQCKNVDDIILATTLNHQDDVLEALGKDNGLRVFRGEEEDVLSRYYYAAKKYKLDIIIRITSDCPLIDPEIIDSMVLRFLSCKEIDYLSNTIKRTFPRGLDTEIFTFASLKQAFELAKAPYEREHVTPYIYEHNELFRISCIENQENLSNLRWTLDEEKDFEFINEIYKRLYKENKIFITKDILKIFEEEIPLKEINMFVAQKAAA